METKLKKPKKKYALHPGRELASIKLQMGNLLVEVHGAPDQESIDVARDLLGSLDSHIRTYYWKEQKIEKATEYR